MSRNATTPIYMISSDSELLIQDERQRLMTQLEKTGPLELQRYTVSPQFDWAALYNDCQSNSLFSNRRLIEINHQRQKLDQKSSKNLLPLAKFADNNLYILIKVDKLTATQTKTNWFQKLNQCLSFSAIKTPYPNELPRWIKQRSKRYRLNIDDQAAQLLAELTTGNLLASDQALQKCQLLDYRQVDQKAIQTVISDSAQFQLFDLGDACLSGDLNQALRILTGVRQQGTEAILVLWCLSKEIRTLYHLAFDLKKGLPMQQVLSKQWASKKPLYQKALSRLSVEQLSDWLKNCQAIDQQIKSSSPHDPWLGLTQLCQQICR
jgi:DNA polymerase-3 subunit delta